MLELRGDVGIATPEPVWRDRRLARTQSGVAPELLRQEILPRLLQAHAVAASPSPIESLARAVIDGDEGAARQTFAQLALASCGDVRPLHEALAAAARRLGEWWLEDACDFFAVSQGVARLQALLATLAEPCGDEASAPAMLMLTLPGETHRFGAEMAAALFRRQGWRVERADGDLSALDMQSFDAVALSCGCERAAATLPQVIADIKARVRLRRTPILLGGALFLGQPACAQNLGVDFVASNPDLVMRFSRALLNARHL